MPYDTHYQAYCAIRRRWKQERSNAHRNAAKARAAYAQLVGIELHNDYGWWKYPDSPDFDQRKYLRARAYDYDAKAYELTLNLLQFNCKPRKTQCTKRTSPTPSTTASVTLKQSKC